MMAQHTCTQVYSNQKQCISWVQDIIFSFPVKCKAGKWEIVQGLPIDEFSKAKLKATGRPHST